MKYKKLKYIAILFFLFWVKGKTLYGQHTIKGIILDIETKTPLSQVAIKNIYTSKKVNTNELGEFNIEVRKNELIEVSYLGYEILRIRIFDELNPSFYHLFLKRATKQLPNVTIRGKHLDFKKDSMKYSRYYEHILKSEKKEDMNTQNLALAMLSKKNREKWAFQKMFARWENEKFVDSKFNEKIILNLTAIPKDKINEFIDLYKPSYELTRHLSDYDFLEYIKLCAEEFINDNKKIID